MNVQTILWIMQKLARAIGGDNQTTTYAMWNRIRQRLQVYVI